MGDAHQVEADAAHDRQPTAERAEHMRHQEREATCEQKERGHTEPPARAPQRILLAVPARHG